MTVARRLLMLGGMRVLDHPSRARLTALALRALEDAATEARQGPVRRTFGHRLALAWLAHEGIGLPWHYEHFWTTMADPFVTANDLYKSYQRTTTLNGLLDYWHLALGWKRPVGGKTLEGPHDSRDPNPE